MKRLRAFVATGLLACSAVAWSAPYSDLFVFGDSLSDPGNAHALSGGAGGAFPPTYGYPQPITRFTNGPTAAEVLAGRLGVPATGNLSPSGGPNHAVGGALSGTGNLNWAADLPAGIQAGLPALQNTGVASQVAGFAGATPAFDPAGALFMVWVGANDFFLWTVAGTPDTLLPTAQAAATNVRDAIDVLYGLGAREFLVPNMPDLGLVPATNGSAQASAAGSAYAGVFNATLAALLAQAEATRPGLDIVSYDVYALLGSIVATPGAFGFTDVAAPCVADPAATLNGCAGYLFWDGVHPTAAAHALLGAEFAAAVGAVPLPGTLVLLLAGLAPAAGLYASRRAASASARS